MHSRRLPSGGLIDRSRTLAFSFDGRRLHGHPGDTLASALLASGVDVVGRSFKYHRPRGLLAAGVEEPNALVGVGSGGRFEPNTRASDVFLYDGLVAESQNRWPSLAVDIGAAAGLIAPFIPAGFYYKTFLGSPRVWKVYEHFIRAAAGLGRPPVEADVDGYEHRAAFCDVLVVGAGRSGLTAAREAAARGERVILVEQDRRLGGGLLRDHGTTGGLDTGDLAAAASEAVGAAGGRVLSRSTAIGYWDHDLVTVAERLAEPGQPPAPGGPVQRLWRIRARRVILATGAIERPMLFAHNDLPGVMLSRAVRGYAARFGVAAGERAVVATCHDDAYRTAHLLAEAGVEVVAVLDTRRQGDAGAVALTARERFPVYFDAGLVAVRPRRGRLAGVDALAGGRALHLAGDLLAVCGGFSPVVHLHMQAGGALAWREDLGAFVPGSARQHQTTVGSAAGELPPGAALHPIARVERRKTFVDLQNDVTLADLDLAWREGYRSVEHLKRYTTVGMATDQGKTSNILALAALARLEGKPVADVGITTFRPPYTPVTLGLLAGPATREHVAPTRRSPLFEEHRRLGALWQPSGYWTRPRAYPRQGEEAPTAAMRAARAVRTTVGFTDVSTLAKFEVAGPDAARFLERVCATGVARLAVGRGRYTFMLREDGMVFDDGTVWRLDRDRFLLTSSTGGADRMEAHLSYVRHVLSAELRVAIVEVQEHWAGLALAGPQAAAILFELCGSAPPAHMAVSRGMLAGQAVLVLAASYSGERAFEIHASGAAIVPVWRAVEAVAARRGGCPYGLDTLEILRIEKGHLVVGGEIDGRMTPLDLGLGRVLRRGGGYVGAQGLSRPALHSPGRLQLVGLETRDGPIPEGAMLRAGPAGEVEGHVTAAGLRVLTSGSIALGFLRDGRARHGQSLIADSPTRGAASGSGSSSRCFMIPKGAPTVIEPMPPAVIFQIDVWGDLAAFGERFARACGAAPPAAGRSLDIADGRRALWIQPRAWLVRGAAEGGDDPRAQLDSVVGEDGAVTDVSAGFSRLRICGADWRDWLSLGGVIDTGGREVIPGWCAGTVVEHLPVRLDVIDAQTVDIYVAPSYASHLRRLWGAEPGV